MRSTLCFELHKRLPSRHQFCCAGVMVAAPKPTAFSGPGTLISVEGLFDNVPLRKKVRNSSLSSGQAPWFCSDLHALRASSPPHLNPPPPTHVPASSSSLPVLRHGPRRRLHRAGTLIAGRLQTHAPNAWFQLSCCRH